MTKVISILLSVFILSFLFTQTSLAQCSICSKTVMQMGAKPAQGFNSGIIYLMLVPYAAIGVIGYKWWKSSNR